MKQLSQVSSTPAKAAYWEDSQLDKDFDGDMSESKDLNQANFNFSQVKQ